MPDVEPHRFPSREGPPNKPDLVSHEQADLQASCSGRRQTSALLDSPSLCVNNAIHHIQALKVTVETWCEQSGKYQPQINQDMGQYSKASGYQSKDSDSESVTPTELYVEGIAISARESCPLSPMLKKINDVVGEVVRLIERLEADRRYAEQALSKEKMRRTMLENKFDCITLWRQQEHSLAVQKEHEACIRDVTELKWQLKLERDKVDQAKDKLAQTKLWNQRLLADIDFAEKQVPIVNENLLLQGGAIDKINDAQAEATERNTEAQNELALAEKELNQTELDNSNEEAAAKKVLLNMQRRIANMFRNTNDQKTLETELCADIGELQKIVDVVEAKCAEKSQRLPEIMEREQTERDKISELQFQIQEQLEKNMKLKKNLLALQEQIDKTRLDGDAEVSRLEEELRLDRNKIADLRRQNMEDEQSIDDYKVKISQSDKVMKQMREERKQMLQKIAGTEEQCDKAAQELTLAEVGHEDTETRLGELERRAVVDEQKAKKHIENLRKDLTGHMTTVELLKGQCAHANEELLRYQRSSEKINEKLEKEFNEGSTVKNTLEAKTELVTELIESLEELQSEHSNTLENLEKEQACISDILQAAQHLHTDSAEQYDDILGNISELKKKCKEHQEASERMENIVESVPEVVEEFQSVYDVVKFKNESAALIMSSLRSDIDNCQQGAQRSMQTHGDHMTARTQALEDTKEALRLALKENKQLAVDYESMTKIHMETKKEVMAAMGERNLAQTSFNYYTQLSLLQKRMHKALVKYFKQRTLYSQAELDRCQALSHGTIHKIETAQDGLSEETMQISAFLQSLTDDSTIGGDDDAGVNKHSSPDATGSNE